MSRLVAVALAAALLAGCAVRRTIEPVSHPIDAPLCVKDNRDVVHKDFLDTLCDEFERHGVRTWVYETERPADCRYHVRYTARWAGSVVTYLRYADVEVFDGERPIGHAVYDAGPATANPAKYGSARSKLRALVDDLMHDVDGER